MNYFYEEEEIPLGSIEIVTNNKIYLWMGTYLIRFYYGKIVIVNGTSGFVKNKAVLTEK